MFFTDPSITCPQPWLQEKVAAFLDRHGFPDVNKPRDNGLYRSISVEPLHPLQVAEQCAGVNVAGSQWVAIESDGDDVKTVRSWE